MIGIKVYGEWLELPEDISVAMSLNNPIYADEFVIPGSYSLPFEIPFGEKSSFNSRILKNVDVIENTERLKKVPAELYIDGNRYKVGELMIGKHNTERGRLSTNFKFGIGTLADDIKTKKVNEICNEAVVMADSAFVKRVRICANTSSYVGTFYIILNGRTYSGASNLALANAINADATEPRVKATYTAGAYAIPGYGTVISGVGSFTVEPFDAGEAANIETPLTIAVPDDQPYLKIHIDSAELQTSYNNPVRVWLDAHLEDERFRFPMVVNKKLYGDEKIKYITGLEHNVSNFCKDNFVLNQPNYYESDLVFGPLSTFFSRNYTSIQPFLRLQWLVEKCAEYFNVGLEGDFITLGEYTTALWYHSNTLDIRMPFIGAQDWIATRREFNTSEFAPEISFIDLLKYIGLRFCCAVYYNEATRCIRIQTRKPIIESAVFEDITVICSPPQEVEDISLTGIRLEAVKDKEDEAALDDFYETGTVEQVIPCPLSGLGSQQTFTSYVFGLFPTTSVYSVPVSKRPKSTKIPNVLFFYTGIDSTDGTLAVDYPSANIDHEDGVFALSGVTGTVARRWKNWLRFLLQRKEDVSEISFELRHVNQLDWEKKVMIDRVKYLFKSISVKFTSRKIEVSKVNAYKS